MRNAETVLGVLRERGRRHLPLERVYRLLFVAVQPEWRYGGAVAGGSQGPSVNSWVRASSASMRHLAAVDR